jgi:mannose-1-phosphate guanylyltransferase
VVVNGDVLTDLDVAALVQFHRTHGGQATIHLTPVEDPSAFGVVPTDDDGRVLAFIEKPPRDEAPTNLVNGGTYVLEPEVLDRIPTGRKVSIERETFPLLVSDGLLYAMATDDYWLDAGRPDLYLQANLDVLDGRRRRPGGPALAATADVAHDASVTHSVVGRWAHVQPGAVVTDSVLLDGAVVERDARIERSVLASGAVAGAGAHLTDCVLGNGVHVPPGAVHRGVRIPDET